ncbi:MAG: amidohydrolase family protein [Acidimicrobiales bacterium]|nr:amidohydrolase family protein [Acidimicrobiales bacterium]
MATTLFEDAALLDVEAGALRPGSWVLVDGERIVDVADGPLRGGPEPRLRVACRGRTLLPGLIDAHVHVGLSTLDIGAMARRPVTLVANEAGAELQATLRRGYTTVRDAGGADHGLARAVELGVIRGPRLFFSGRVLSQTGGHGDFRPYDDAPRLCGCEIHSSSFSHVVDGVDSVRRAAREELRRGATQIKVMASGGVASPSDPIWVLQYSEGELRAAVEEAEAWRTYVMAHAYTPGAIARAVHAGVRSIEHGNLLDDATAALMAEWGAFLVPTLVTYEKLAELGAALGFPAVGLAKLDDVLEQGLGSLEVASRAGVPIGFGTDLLGETRRYQSDELLIRARVQTPADVLRSATLVNAALLQRDGELGVIRAGALADLLLVDGDPLRDLGVLAGERPRIDLVMKGGAVAAGSPT